MQRLLPTGIEIEPVKLPLREGRRIGREHRAGARADIEQFAEGLKASELHEPARKHLAAAHGASAYCVEHRLISAAGDVVHVVIAINFGDFLEPLRVRDFLDETAAAAHEESAAGAERLAVRGDARQACESRYFMESCRAAGMTESVAYHCGQFEFCPDSMPAARNVVLLGASGVLGRALAHALGERLAGRTFLRHPIVPGVRFDARTDSVTGLIDRLPMRPHVAVVLLGETRIDACAADPAGTAEINVTAVTRVVAELVALDIQPVFVSSDAVFDGCKPLSTEDDRPNPILTYGRQKILAERFVAALAFPWVVVRLPKLLSPMVEDWIAALGRTQAIECATDQYFNPMLPYDAAAAIVALIDHGVQGLYHVAGPERLSRRQLLDAVVDEYRRFAEPVASVLYRPMREIEKARLLREPRPLDTSIRSIRLAGLRMPSIEPASRAARAMVANRFQ